MCTKFAHFAVPIVIVNNAYHQNELPMVVTIIIKVIENKSYRYESFESE